MNKHKVDEQILKEVTGGVSAEITPPSFKEAEEACTGLFGYTYYCVSCEKDSFFPDTWVYTLHEVKTELAVSIAWHADGNRWTHINEP